MAKIAKDSKKPKHGMDKNRENKETGSMRSAATVRRLKMYNSGRPVRDKKGKIVSQDLQSKELPTTRIVPDRRWFGNTRVVGQKQLQSFREQMAGKADSPFAVLLRQRKLPLQLLEDPEAKVDAKRKRKDVLRQFSFAETFGSKSGQRQKRPRISAEAYEDLVAHAEEQEQGYLASVEGGDDAYANKDLREFATVKQKYLDKGQSKRIWGELYKVIDSSDVVIQVLDARDPDGTRCTFLENHLRKNHREKHLILLLNKVDLVPPRVTRAWLRRLSADFPVLAFRSGLTKAFGKGALISLLRQIARLRSDKKAISVGFIGYPNVGKSSVINTLRTKKVCEVAPVPGQTKVWQYVTLMKRVFLIDCPGVVYARDASTRDDAAMVLKGVVRIERLEDAAEFVPEVLRRVKPDYLKRAYKLTSWTDAPDFLDQVARASGKLTRGGEADTNTAARMVLLDWQRGRLPSFRLPPDYDAAADAAAPATAAAAAAVAAAAPTAAADQDADADADADGSGSEDGAAPGGPEEVRQMAEVAVAAAEEQCAGAIPVRGEFFDAEDLGGVGAVEQDLEVSDDDISEDEGSLLGSDANGEDAEGTMDADAAEGDVAAAEEDEGDGGYGDDGLGWQAVLGDVLGEDAEEAASGEEEESGDEAAEDADGTAAAPGADGGEGAPKRGKGGKKCRHGGDGLTQEERGIGVRLKKPEGAVGSAGGGGRRGSGASADGGGGGKSGGKGKQKGGVAVGERQPGRKGGAAGKLAGVAKVSKAVRNGKGKKGGKNKGGGK